MPLPLADVLPFALGHVGQELENDVRNERPGQVPVIAGVQQGHIQHPDFRLYLLGDMPPLLQNFLIVTPQPVDAFDD